MTEDIRERLLKEKQRLQTLRREIENDWSGEEAETGFVDSVAAEDLDMADVASDSVEREKDMSVAANLDGQIEDIDRALARLDEDNYGICEECGKEIDPDRLDAMPATTLCIEDQRRLERTR